jgi:hypothetical protein
MGCASTMRPTLYVLQEDPWVLAVIATRGCREHAEGAARGA